MTRRCFFTLLCLLPAVVRGWAEPAPERLRLFLLIGQSNMSGRGKVMPQDTVTNERIFMLTKEQQWTLAKDPLHYDKGRVGVGLASEFARVVLKANPKARIGLIPCAVGGTTLASWKPGGEHYNEAVARTRAAQKNGKLACILWHQGESDCTPEKIAVYPAEFAAMIAQLRKDLEAPEVPVIIGEIGRFYAGAESFNAIIPRTAVGVPRCDFVTSEDLTGDVDQTHFNTVSLRTYGQRYAESYLKMDPPKAK